MHFCRNATKNLRKVILPRKPHNLRSLCTGRGRVCTGPSPRTSPSTGQVFLITFNRSSLFNHLQQVKSFQSLSTGQVFSITLNRSSYQAVSIIFNRSRSYFNNLQEAKAFQITLVTLHRSLPFEIFGRDEEESGVFKRSSKLFQICQSPS